MLKRYAENVEASSAKFEPSRNYLPALILALAAGSFSIWCGLKWWPAFIPAGCFFVSMGALVWAMLRPVIVLDEQNLRIGKETISWNQIRRVDRSRWISPLVLYLTLLNERRIRLIYPGEADMTQYLLLELRRRSKEALIDGVPYRRFWGELIPNAIEPPTPSSAALTSITQAVSLKQATIASSKPRMIRVEDEAEIERMFQRLKTTGQLDPHADSKKNPSDR